MNVTLHVHDEFKRQFRQLKKKYRSLTDDLENLQRELKENPFQGTDLGSGVRKIRMSIASKGKGKSGGARVLTLNILVSDDAQITLLTIYDKNEIDNVSEDYIRWLISEAQK
ncbi:MAG: type II toxin-antitoxin system RelE/ParE family toxin [Bacteroidaceae bacterium]|nr:type II toxin-antitoxin system RelE/ParE family toxin [Bacteroidaceae bacterium]